MIRALVPLLALGISVPLSAQALDITNLPPMKWVEQVIPEDLPPLEYPEYAETLDRVETQLKAGRYRLALQTITLSDERTTPRAQTLKARTLLAMGRFEEARELLEQQPPDEVTSALRAEAMAMAGERRPAIALISEQLKNHPHSVVLHLKLAELLESVGEISAAREALGWFAQQEYLNQWREGTLRQVDDAQQLLMIAHGLDRLAVLAGHYRRDLRLHQDILAMFVRAYDILDRRNADAHLRAAQFFWAHDDERSAKEELIRSLDINGQNVEALALVGELSLESYEFESCEKAIALIREINEDHPAAALLTAQLLLTQRQPDEAYLQVEQLVKHDPENALYAAYLAACDAMRGDGGMLDARLRELDARMPESSLPYDVPARYLLDAFQFKDAARLLHVAVERTPHWNAPRNRLALAYMQQTDTEKARPILEEARQLDPFNVKTTNYLRLLDGIMQFELAESEHFAVRYSAAHDPFLAEEVLAYMEEQYPRIARNFGHEPAEKTVIELMPTSEDFAVRTTGKPWIGTVGASAGPLITMVAPRAAGKTNGPFDWCDVTRHEFVHTVTLAATNQRIPRWFTEGLAVSEQRQPLPYEQAKLLADAVAGGKLFSIRRINWAFIRPRTPTDQPLAYAQSLWLCRYIEQQHGADAVLQMLKLYGEGLHTEQVVGKALKTSTFALDEQFAKWAAEEVVRLGMDEISQSQVNDLTKIGEAAIRANEHAKALDQFVKAYAVCPGDPLINQRLAGLYLHKSINDPASAVKHLTALDSEQLSDNRYSIRLARLHEQLNDLPQAVAAARRATQLDPYDPLARDTLAKLLAKSGETAAAETQKQRAQTIRSMAKG